MEKKILAFSSSSRNGLDDDYTLYDDGQVLHEYDRHIYKGGYGLSETLKASELKPEVKLRLLDKTSETNLILVKQLLNP
ncbi:hypothetical protein [Pedobacter sp. AJM]|uniref:hypothetical protein n=1 Tax=Pedobacter sp. AJM TaxID=2003629 RepID=UPI000B4A8A48|nr:hypothetical protein [Pedobacter sp. AJM]OWK71433.1 hypothetical protein CBW18_10285 [Pedobacter sp. AJM]